MEKKYYILTLLKQYYLTYVVWVPIIATPYAS